MPFASEADIVLKIETALADRTEVHDVEFKDARGGVPQKLWETVTSFSLMPGGGIIVFGVTDDRATNTIEVVGGLSLHDLQEGISNYYRDKMERVGVPEMVILTIQNERLLVLKVPEAPVENRPPYLKSKGLPDGACIRDGITDRRMTYDEMAAFIRDSSVNFKYDQMRAESVQITDLNQGKMEDFFRRSAVRAGRPTASNTPTDSLMINAGIAGDFTGSILPTFSGFMIFATDNPQDLQPYSRYIIRCVRYQGSDVASPIIDRLDLGGTLDNQITGIMGFLLRNIPLQSRIVGTKRVDTYEYPEEALRELVANAVIHRDYTVTETYTQINIFSNRIEISNPGNLPPGITVDTIRDSQFSRNQNIAAILRNLDFLEEYGRGIDIVYSKMDELSLLPPIFKNSANSFKVILLGSAFGALNARQVEIWHKLQEVSRLTARQMVDMFHPTSRPTINSDIRKLLDLELIVSRDSGYNTYYEARF